MVRVFRAVRLHVCTEVVHHLEPCVRKILFECLEFLLGELHVLVWAEQSHARAGALSLCVCIYICIYIYICRTHRGHVEDIVLILSYSRLIGRCQLRPIVAFLPCPFRFSSCVFLGFREIYRLCAFSFSEAHLLKQYERCLHVLRSLVNRQSDLCRGRVLEAVKIDPSAAFHRDLLHLEVYQRINSAASDAPELLHLLRVKIIVGDLQKPEVFAAFPSVCCVHVSLP